MCLFLWILYRYRSSEDICRDKRKESSCHMQTMNGKISLRLYEAGQGPGCPFMLRYTHLSSCGRHHHRRLSSNARQEEFLSEHMTFGPHRFNVDATSRRCIDADSTLFQCCVSAWFCLYYLHIYVYTGPANYYAPKIPFLRKNHIWLFPSKNDLMLESTSLDADHLCTS